MHPDNMDSILSFLAVPFGVAMAISAATLVLHFFARMMRMFEETQGEDKRKKKKDEYEAYYDERLDSSDPNIAYYEDISAGAVHHE